MKDAVQKKLIVKADEREKIERMAIVALKQQLAGNQLELKELRQKLRHEQTKAKESHDKIEAQKNELIDQKIDFNKRLYKEYKKVQQLISYVEALNYDTQAVFNSITWKIGCFLIACARKIILRPSVPTAQDHIDSVIRDFSNWKKYHLQTSQSTALIQSIPGNWNQYNVADSEVNGSLESFDLRTSIDIFEEDSYLSQNPDIYKAVERGDFETAQQHWNKFGKVEIANRVRVYVPGVLLKSLFEPHFKNSLRDKLREKFLVGRSNPLYQ
ncbi:MAG: hypothetical protein R3F37_09190 [Candidatus Competibacteraceae bacterium]